MDYTVEVRYSPALEPITVIHGAWTFQRPVGLFHCVVTILFHLGIVDLFYHDIDALNVMCILSDLRYALLYLLIVEIILLIYD